MEGISANLYCAVQFAPFNEDESFTLCHPSLLSVAAGRLHPAPGQGDAGSGAGLHSPHRGLRVRQPAVVAAGNAAHVEEEQAY